MHRPELLKYARIGAHAKLEALQNEMDGLLKTFPGLRILVFGRFSSVAKVLAERVLLFVTVTPRWT
jgi:hypothetical protein